MVRGWTTSHSRGGHGALGRSGIVNEKGRLGIQAAFLFKTLLTVNLRIADHSDGVSVCDASVSSGVFSATAHEKLPLRFGGAAVLAI